VEPLLTYRGAVFTWHCDHMGHMNVMWYVGKFDEASWNFLARIGITPSYLRDSDRGMVAVEHKVSYKRELLAGDILEVHSHIVEVRDKAILFTHEMRNGETGDVAAVCQFTGVHIDKKLRKACAFSPEMRAEAAKYASPPAPTDAA
jgi:acyl-CoA thioester hydrolase